MRYSGPIRSNTEFFSFSDSVVKTVIHVLGFSHNSSASLTPVRLFVTNLVKTNILNYRRRKTLRVMYNYYNT